MLAPESGVVAEENSHAQATADDDRQNDMTSIKPKIQTLSHSCRPGAAGNMMAQIGVRTVQYLYVALREPLVRVDTTLVCWRTARFELHRVHFKKGVQLATGPGQSVWGHSCTVHVV